jgi:hypothetical protein
LRRTRPSPAMRQLLLPRSNLRTCEEQAAARDTVCPQHPLAWHPYLNADD